MLTDAIISGSLGRALFRDGDRLCVLDGSLAEPRLADPDDLSAFRHIAREVALADPSGLPISADALRSRLDEEIDFFTGLDGLLVGMDTEFSETLRRRAIRKANDILAESDTLAKRIRARFLVPANTQEWDPGGALELAQQLSAEAAAASYRPIANGTVDRIADDIAELTRIHFGTGIEAQSRRDGLIRSGLIAELCAAIGNRTELLGLLFRKDLAPNLDHLDPGRKILTTILKHLAGSEQREPSAVQESDDDNDPLEDDRDPIAIAVSRAMQGPLNRKRKGGLDYDLRAIQREIAWIGERLQRNEAERAEAGLIRLVDHQARNSRPEDIVKSLTAVADHARRSMHFDFAERVLNAADLLEASDHGLMCVRGEMLRDRAQPEEALAVFREAMERFPSIDIPRNAYAETLRELGRTEEALAVFRETMARFPLNAVTRNAYAETLWELGRPEEALAVLRETMDRFPHDEVAPTAYAEKTRELGRTEEALAVFRQTMDRFPDSAVIPNAYAETLRELGQTEEALNILGETMDRFPHDEVAANAYAETLRELGRIEEALAVFRETMDRFPHDVVASNAYAETLRELGRGEEALAVFRETMDRFPHDEVAPNAYAQTLRELGRAEEALSVLRGTTDRFPHDEVAPNAYAETLRELGRTEEALSVFRETMSRFPHDVVAPTAYAETLRELGQTEEALAVFRETMDRFPHDEVIPTAYAETLRELGRTEEALAAFRKSVERFPHNAIGRCAYANMLIATGKVHEGEALLTEAIDRLQTHNDWVALHIVAMGHLRRNSMETALSMLQYGRNNCPYLDVAAYFRSALALALIMDRKAQEALMELEPAIQQATPKFQKATTLLVKAHALGECGDVRATKGELTSINDQFVLSTTQRELADTIMATYVHRDTPLTGRARAAANDNIFRLEFELMTSAIGGSSGAIRRAA